ncbi:hypothetical protein J6590_000303 [Homalodisca vitripennis]|nr:hypothetical protein J6590_000303 [Homalodisca vitripennis]
MNTFLQSATEGFLTSSGSDGTPGFTLMSLLHQYLKRMAQLETIRVRPVAGYDCRDNAHIERLPNAAFPGHTVPLPRGLGHSPQDGAQWTGLTGDFLQVGLGFLSSVAYEY